VEVHSLAIPSAQTVNGESMTQVIGPRSDPTFFRLQCGQLKQKTEGTSCGLDWQPALIHADEKACILVRGRIRHPSSKVSIQFSG